MDQKKNQGQFTEPHPQNPKPGEEPRHMPGGQETGRDTDIDEQDEREDLPERDSDTSER